MVWVAYQRCEQLTLICQFKHASPTVRWLVGRGLLERRNRVQMLSPEGFVELLRGGVFPRFDEGDPSNAFDEVKEET